MGKVMAGFPIGVGNDIVKQSQGGQI